MAIASALSIVQGRVIEYPWHSLAVAAVVVPILYVVLNEFVRASARIKGMKGPRGFPLIGNLSRFGRTLQSSIASGLRIRACLSDPVGNIPVVVVNSAASAKVLFGQNAQALSSRPEFYTFHKVSRKT